MAKQFKLKIKNIQLAQAAGIGKDKAGKEAIEKEEKVESLPPDVKSKEKPSKAKSREKEKEKDKDKDKSKVAPVAEEAAPRRIRAKSKSSFNAAGVEEAEEITEELAPVASEEIETEEVAPQGSPLLEELLPESPVEEGDLPTEELPEAAPTKLEPTTKREATKGDLARPDYLKTDRVKTEPKSEAAPSTPKERELRSEKLGPTGRHVKDLYQAPKVAPPAKPAVAAKKESPPPPKPKESGSPSVTEEDDKARKKVREFKDLRPRREMRTFEARGDDEGERWRKRRPQKGGRSLSEEPIIRPTKLKVRVPISLKDLASEMKLKSSELIQKLFLQGMVCTLNDLLEDPVILVFIGNEFGCEITIDSSEEERIEITKKTIQEEILGAVAEDLQIRPPVVTFMGHVDHGKTSLIDTIRKSNVAASEAGAITQHIGAFRCQTAVGSITILDTPGHEAFSEMRARGAEVTDIVVLVVAGDEGIREQTKEAMHHAKTAGVTIIVAINKSDKPNFNAENIYRQLSEIELLPEVWGGQTITVNTSAVTGEGIPQLLEMLALQAEILELKADPKTRARGTVLESELHKGFGPVATILVQNGTLRLGDPIVLDRLWGRIKTMRDEFGKQLKEAGPSTPVAITGLSGIPEAGDSFIVVKSEKEARDIAEARATGVKQKSQLQKKIAPLESLQQLESDKEKKILKLILRADVQGSMEALKASLSKIQSDKASLDIIFSGVGEITESDVELAAASKAVIIGFHSEIETRASSLIKELAVVAKLHNIIYHAIDDVRALMKGLLEKIVEEKDTGKAEVKAVFKASQLGQIAGCQVIEGTILRNNKMRLLRGGKVLWKGSIASLKRVKEDVREVKKGLECGILLEGFNDFQVGDILQAYELVYHVQEL